MGEVDGCRNVARLVEAANVLTQLTAFAAPVGNIALLASVNLLTCPFPKVSGLNYQVLTSKYPVTRELA